MIQTNDNIIKTFLDLVQIDSISWEEEDVRKYIEGRLVNLGMDYEVDEIGNLFMRVEGDGESVVLSCHMDTVEPGRGIEPVIENGIIRSKGDTILGADNKVAVAAILELLENLPKKHVPLEVIFSVREELEGGINQFDFTKLKSKIGILPDKDAPIGAIVSSAPGIIDFKITVTGKAAHAGRPHKGNNALVPVLEALGQLTLGQVDEVTTINIGIIKGGSTRNTVPESVYLEGEVRSFDSKSLEQHRNNIRSLFESASGKYKVELDFVSELQFESYNYDPSTDSISRIIRIMEEFRITPMTERSFGGSDASTFAKKGIEVVNIGDGSENAHTTDECVSTENLVRLTELLAKYVSL